MLSRDNRGSQIKKLWATWRAMTISPKVKGWLNEVNCYGGINFNLSLIDSNGLTVFQWSTQIFHKYMLSIRNMVHIYLALVKAMQLEILLWTFNVKLKVQFWRRNYGTLIKLHSQDYMWLLVYFSYGNGIWGVVWSKTKLYWTTPCLWTWVDCNGVIATWIIERRANFWTSMLNETKSRGGTGTGPRWGSAVNQGEKPAGNGQGKGNSALLEKSTILYQRISQRSLIG